MPLNRKAPPQAVSDDLEWRDRCNFWANYRPINRGGKKKYAFREPLILAGHGIRISVHRNTLLIRPGITHYPQSRDEVRFFPGDPNLPDRIIILDGSGGISFDALNWMSGQQIILVQLNWRGEISAVGGGANYSASPKLVDAQLKAQNSGRNLQIARWLISKKIAASLSTLKTVIPNSQIQENAIIRLQKRQAELKNIKKAISAWQLLGIEGDCAAAYFRSWHGAPIKWSGLNRKPIPANWHEISARTMTWRKGIQNARHPINAMLNYGYGVMKATIQGQIIAAGLNPSIGVMHSGTHKNRAPLVYDLMEPFRPVVDRLVLEFALGHTFTPADFTINSVGGCRLNPEMARVVAARIANIADSLQMDEFLKKLT